MLEEFFYWVFYNQFRSAVNERNVRGQLEPLLFIVPAPQGGVIQSKIFSTSPRKSTKSQQKH